MSKRSNKIRKAQRRAKSIIDGYKKGEKQISLLTERVISLGMSIEVIRSENERLRCRNDQLEEEIGRTYIFYNGIKYTIQEFKDLYTQELHGSNMLEIAHRQLRESYNQLRVAKGIAILPEETIEEKIRFIEL